MTRTLVLTLLLLDCSAATAQVVVGAPITVNTDARPVSQPAVAMNQSGASLVAWVSRGTDLDVRARRFDATGQPLGDQFAVPVSSAENQQGVSVALDDAGRYAVLWTTSAQGGRVFVRRFAADGTPTSGDVLVGPPQPAAVEAAVALHPNGEALVVTQLVSTTTTSDLMLRRLAADGREVATPLRVNSTPLVTTRTVIGRASIGVGRNGEFVIAWFHPERTTYSVRMQRFTREAVPIGEEVLVREERVMTGILRVAFAADGAFAISWSEAIGSRTDGFAQLYTASGAPSTLITIESTGAQFLSAVTFTPAGELLVTAWQSQIASVQRYTRTGARSGNAIAVAAPTLGVAASNGSSVLTVRLASATELSVQRVQLPPMRRRAALN